MVSAKCDPPTQTSPPPASPLLYLLSWGPWAARQEPSRQLPPTIASRAPLQPRYSAGPISYLQGQDTRETIGWGVALDPPHPTAMGTHFVPG